MHISLGQKAGVITGSNCVEAKIQGFYECTRHRGWKELSLSAAVAPSGITSGKTGAFWWLGVAARGGRSCRSTTGPVAWQGRDPALIPPYMNLQLCPSGWIQRWCIEAWLILRHSTFYKQGKKKWPHETSSRWASATRPKAVSCSRRGMIEHDK